MSLDNQWGAELIEGDFAPMLALFERSFGHAMDPRLRVWKYGEGRGQQVGLYDGESLIAHYGGMTRRILKFGEPCLACQIGDVMVAPEYRGQGGRRGPYFRVMAGYSEAFCGYDKKHLIGYGFPSYQALRLAVLLKQYTEIDRMAELSWSATPHPGLHATSVDRTWLLANRDRVTRLWRRMADSLASDAVIAVRDVDYLIYRYCDHPTQNYDIHWVRQGLLRRELGLVITKVYGDRVELMDVVGRPDNFQHLIAYARHHAAALGLSRLIAWGTRKVCDTFCGASVKELDIYIPTCTWTAGPTPDELRYRWWLMLGDTDYQ